MVKIAHGYLKLTRKQWFLWDKICLKVRYFAVMERLLKEAVFLEEDLYHLSEIFVLLHNLRSKTMIFLISQSTPTYPELSVVGT